MSTILNALRKVQRDRREKIGTPDDLREALADTPEIPERQTRLTWIAVGLLVFLGMSASVFVFLFIEGEEEPTETAQLELPRPAKAPARDVARAQPERRGPAPAKPRAAPPPATTKLPATAVAEVPPKAVAKAPPKPPAKAPAKAVAKAPPKPPAKAPAKAVAKAPPRQPAKAPAKAVAKAPPKQPAKAPAKTTGAAVPKPTPKQSVAAPPPGPVVAKGSRKETSEASGNPFVEPTPLTRVERVEAEHESPAEELWELPGFPRMELESVRWHPNPQRRIARVQLEHARTVDVREGDVVKGVRIHRIDPGAVELELGDTHRRLSIGK